jgi:hypothetical protein
LTKALSGAGWDAKGLTAEQVRMEQRRDFPALSTISSAVVSAIAVGDVVGRRERGSNAASPSARQRATSS